MTNNQRMLIAGAGALVPIAVLLINLDPGDMFTNFQLSSFMGWSVRTIILFGCGAVVGLLHSDENNKKKLFQLGIAAPAVLASWLGISTLKAELKEKSTPNTQSVIERQSSIPAASSIFTFFINTAYAQQPPATNAQPQNSFLSGFIDGFTGRSQKISPPIQEPRQWILSKNGNVPFGAFQAGSEIVNGRDYQLFVCVAKYKSGMHPGKIRTGINGCDITFGRKEILIDEYSVLMSANYEWKTKDTNPLPSNTIAAGKDVPPKQETLYICRAKIPGKDGIHPGKVRSDFAGCNVGWGGDVFVIPEYEILTQ